MNIVEAMYDIETLGVFTRAAHAMAAGSHQE